MDLQRPTKASMFAATACLCALALVACGQTDDASPGADGGSANAGASAGNAGAAGHAGAAGGGAGTSASDGDAGQALDDGGAPACAPCIGDTLSWGPNGGHVAFADRSELSQCNVYRHARIPSGDSTTIELECERPVPCMGSGLHGIADVLQALAHPDVMAARAKGMVLFGSDPRHFDGNVLRIELPGSVIDVGSACTGSDPCTAIPAGVAALAALLDYIDDEQLAIEPCLAKFDRSR